MNWSLHPQRRDFHVLGNSRNAAFGANFVDGLLRGERRLYAIDLWTGAGAVAVGREKGQHLTEARERNMNHLARGNRHAALRIDLDDYVVKAFAIFGGVRDRKPLVLRPRDGLFGLPALFLRFRSC